LTSGVCTNLPSNCSKAASREQIPMPTPDTVCPECGSRLQAQAARAGGLPPAALLAGIVGLLLVVAIAVAAWQFMKPKPHHATAAAGGAVLATAPAPPPPGGYLLRLSGSNTVGSDLGPALVRAWLTQKGATDIKDVQRAGPDGAPIPEHVISASLNGKDIAIEVRAHGSANAFKDLVAGTADIGMASRPVNDAEEASTTALGDMRAKASEHVLGLDGIAVIVPASNAVASLSTGTLRRIFTGQVTDWSQLGGSAGPIHLYARDDQSGTYDAFKTMVLQGAPLAQAKRYDDSGKEEADVSHDPGGIGFVGMPYVKTTRAAPVYDGSAAPLLPTVFTVKTENYVLSRRLYLYTAAQPTNSNVADFVAFALSPAGQAVVKQSGFVELDYSQAATPVVASSDRGPCQLSAQWRGDAQEYCALRSKAEQLPLSFRFLTGSSTLDNRAADDLKRIVDRMSQSPNKTIVLVGFADSSGVYASNVALSRARAQAVANALSTLGLKVSDVRGYGPELPVRDNATDVGREQNRRVEMFLE
jgi:phosphate transport system substrate-binding protein